MAQPPRFPNFDGKHDRESLIEPARFVEHMRQTGRFPTVKLPESVILCFQRRLVRHIEQRHRVLAADGFLAGLLVLEETDGRVGALGGFGIGAPAAVTTLEELVACGVRRFVAVGTAGALQRDISVGDLVLCEAAIRDEGTSHHYRPPGGPAQASPLLTARLAAALEQQGLAFRRGTSWTVDAPYRETIAEARHYQAEGVATVEMEASALFTVAAVRGVEMAAMFTISDSLAHLEWRPDFGHPRAQVGLESLFAAAVAALVA